MLTVHLTLSMALIIKHGRLVRIWIIIFIIIQIGLDYWIIGLLLYVSEWIIIFYYYFFFHVESIKKKKKKNIEGSKTVEIHLNDY